MNRRIITYLCFAAGALLLSSASGEDSFAFQHENVLGTSLELRVFTSDAQVAARAEARVLAEIDRLSGL